MEGKLSVVKIDTDKYPSIASRYGIKVRNILLRIRFGPGEYRDPHPGIASRTNLSGGGRTAANASV